MPIDYKEYPDNWKTEIRPRILARAKNRCEWCDKPNHDHPDSQIIGQYCDPPFCAVSRNGVWFDKVRNEWRNPPGDLVDPNFVSPDGEGRCIEIVLTIAHLDHDKQNNADDNLAALCQRCHLNYDRPRHIANRRANRANPAQLSLFP